MSSATMLQCFTAIAVRWPSGGKCSASGTGEALDYASTFGRLTTACVVSSLNERGYSVLQVESAHALRMSRQGTFLLSREAQRLSSSHDVQAVVVGTYGVSADTAYMYLEIVNANTVIAAHDYAVRRYIASALI